MVYSFATVGKLQTKSKRSRRPRQAIAKVDAEAATLVVAKIIDPNAWGDQPQPSIAELEQQIATLTEDLEWLRSVPTTPEGEYQRIRSERRQQALVLAGRLHADAETTRKRQEIALQTARMALDAFNQFTKRRTLIKVVRGRKASWVTQSVRR